MWPEPTINVTQRHLFCELKDLHLCLWPPVLTEPCLQFEILCCSSLTLRQPVSSYGICSSHKLMQECTWVCVVKNTHRNIFFFVHGRQCIQSAYCPWVWGCVWESMCMLFPFVCYQNSFFCQPTGTSFQEFLSCFLCLFYSGVHGNESLCVGSGHLIIKKVNTQHSHVSRKRECALNDFCFFFPSTPYQLVFPI